ncbi:MAG TPA: dihydrodipicolinate synthase family protein [Chthonomonadales bacterium]|nr:dihydrodipicolinate synthase family protein [Chthonomonadales bacterium]
MVGQQIRGQTFSGCFVANVTLMDERGNVDYCAIGNHIEWMIAAGIDGICTAGTTGEFLFLSTEEKRLVTQAAVQTAAGRVPVIAGVWSLDVAEIGALSASAEAAGAQAVFLPPPIYYPASDAAIYHWYSAARKATALPVLAYNIPQYAANEISMQCLDRLFRDGVVQGVKDSSAMPDRIRELVQNFGSNASILAASDSFASEALRLRAHGFISAIGNVCPELMVAIWRGDTRLQTEAGRLRTALKRAGSISALKHLLARQGFANGFTRLPFAEISESDKAALDRMDLSTGKRPR